MSLETLADSVVFLLLTTKKFQHPAHSTLSIYFCPWIGQRNQQKSCHSFSRRCPSVARRIWCKGLMLKDQTMSVVLDGSPLKAMQSSHTHSPQTALRWVVTSTVRGEEAARLTDGVHVPSEVSLLHVKLKESGLRTVEETFRSSDSILESQLILKVTESTKDVKSNVTLSTFQLIDCSFALYFIFI